MGVTSHDSLEVSTCFNLRVGLPNSSGKSEHGLCLVKLAILLILLVISELGATNQHESTNKPRDAGLFGCICHPFARFFSHSSRPISQLMGLIGA